MAERDRFVSMVQLQEMTGLSLSTLRWLRANGRLPRAGKLGRRLIWRESEVLAWIDEQFEKANTPVFEDEPA